MVAIQHFQIGTIDTTVFDVSTGSSVDSGGNALLVTIDPNNDIGAVSIDLNGIKYLKITGKLGTDTRFGEALWPPSDFLSNNGSLLRVDASQLTSSASIHNTAFMNAFSGAVNLRTVDFSGLSDATLGFSTFRYMFKSAEGTSRGACVSLEFANFSNLVADSGDLLNNTFKFMFANIQNTQNSDNNPYSLLVNFSSLHPDISWTEFLDISSLDPTTTKSSSDPFPVQVASATGDPYITPIYGNLYKLPNRTTYYRLLKHNDTIINGEVVRFDEAQINYECALRNFQMDKFAPDNFDLSSMYFFKNIYISHNSNETVYNLLDKSFTNDCIEHEMTQTKLETCKIYYYENMEACEIDLDGIKIKLCTFDNPQIITGIELNANIDLSRASGLLVHQQSVSHICLKTLKAKKKHIKLKNKVEL